jgi:hypothetical protein
VIINYVETLKRNIKISYIYITLQLKWIKHKKKKIRKFKKNSKLIVPYPKSKLRPRSYSLLRGYLVTSELWYNAKKSCLKNINFKKNTELTLLSLNENFIESFTDE